MKMEHRREATQAGRENLMQSLQSLQQATALLQDAAQGGDKSDLLRAGELWTQAIVQAHEAKKLSDELLGEEVQTWIEKS